MSSDTISAQPAAKSPILAAVGISLAIGLGAVLGTTDIATLEEAITGRWLTRSYTETQQGHTVAIAALEHSIGGVTRDIDFVASRAGASIRRNEDRTAATLRPDRCRDRGAQGQARRPSAHAIDVLARRCTGKSARGE